MSPDSCPKPDLRWRKKPWSAKWITTVHGKYNPSISGVFLFRKSFDLSELVERFVVHVSADNRYELYVNGRSIGRGPALSTTDAWTFESYDLAAALRPGHNLLAARVWKWAEPPWAQQSLRTAFILQGDTETEQVVDSGHSWKVKQELGWSFFVYREEEFHYRTGVGPCECLDAGAIDWTWNVPEGSDADWPGAEEIAPGTPTGTGDPRFDWALTPRTIPQMDGRPIRLKRVRRAEGVSVDDSFCRGESAFRVEANSRAVVLFDNGHLAVVRPRLTVAGGGGSRIRLIYGEALFDADLRKQHRDRVDGMELRGYYDRFLPDGERRCFHSLWNRTYRYLQMEIETGDAPLDLLDYQADLDVYPFERRFAFASSDPDLEKIVEVGWRTARMCALETYVDCPYYEQLQYFGDLNVSNPITVLLSGDTRLMRNAILQGKRSRTSEGLLLCAAPSRGGKIIPFFSISWIGMLHFYWTYTGDAELVDECLDVVEGILAWYQSKLNEDFMLGPMNHWNFVDSTESWPWAPERNSICEPSGTREGYSSVLTLQFLYGLQLVDQLLAERGIEGKRSHYAELAEKVGESTMRFCWDRDRQLMADTPERTDFSQHATILAGLTGTLPESADARAILRSLDRREDVGRASLQFRAYYHRALQKNALEADYLEQLQPWKKLIADGFTTFPEIDDLDSRSDCHAWNAYPAYELFTLVAGFRVAAPGFRTVHIAPHLGSLEWLAVRLPWREAHIALRLEQKAGELHGWVELPEGLPATFCWGGQTIPLQPGMNSINLAGSAELPSPQTADNPNGPRRVARVMGK